MTPLLITVLKTARSLLANPWVWLPGLCRRMLQISEYLLRSEVGKEGLSRLPPDSFSAVQALANVAAGVEVDPISRTAIREHHLTQGLRPWAIRKSQTWIH